MKQSMALGLSQMVQSQIVKQNAEPAKKEITDIQVVHRRDGDMSRINGPEDNKEQNDLKQSLMVLSDCLFEQKEVEKPKAQIPSKLEEEKSDGDPFKVDHEDSFSLVVSQVIQEEKAQMNQAKLEQVQSKQIQPKQPPKIPVELVEDQVAYGLYNKFASMVGQPGYQTNETWSNDEVVLLNWSIQRYCQNKGITQHDLNPKNWITISGFVPGRTNQQCEAKFNQGLYIYQESNP